MLLRPAPVALAALLLAAPLRAQAPADALDRSVPAEWRTRAEASGFAETASLADVVAYVEKLARRAPEVRLGTFGISSEGRKLPFVVVSKDRIADPKLLRARPRPIVLVQSSIHGGETDGTDASLMLMREVTIGGSRALLEAVTLLFVPVYNVDGHSRRAEVNRPNQDGPEAGTGERRTTAGLDLNRDHLKADAPETRALLALYGAWRPHLVIDDHVSDGSDHEWSATYAVPRAPQIAPALDAWLWPRMQAASVASTLGRTAIGYYGELRDPLDPAQGFETPPYEPRYASGYWPLRQRPVVLVETHSYKPFRERVQANLVLLRAVVEEIARKPAALLDAVRAAEAAVVAAGKADAAPSNVALTFTDSGVAETVSVPLRPWSVETSAVTGAPVLLWQGGRRALDLPWHRTPKVALEVPRPRGYLVAPGWPEIEARLRAHGLRVLKLTHAAEVEAETIRVNAPVLETRTDQGRVRMKAVVTREGAVRTASAGWLWIPADQPDFEVAVQLLEPEAPDSLFAWGLLSSVTERRVFREGHVLEAAVRATDPSLHDAFRAALADPSFAANATARRAWWEARLPGGDASAGVLPVWRVLRVSLLHTEPWK